MNSPIENKSDINLNFDYFNNDDNRKTNSMLNRSNIDSNLREFRKESVSSSSGNKSKPNSKKKIDIFNLEVQKGSLNSSKSKSKSFKSTKLNIQNKSFQIYNQDNFSCNNNNLRSQNFSINYQTQEIEENKILKKIICMYSEMKQNDIRNKINNDKQDNSMKSMHRNFYQLLSTNIAKNSNAKVNNKILTLRNFESKSIKKKIEIDTKEIKLLNDNRRNPYNNRNTNFTSLTLLGVNNMNDIRLTSAEKRLTNILKSNNI